MQRREFCKLIAAATAANDGPDHSCSCAERAGCRLARNRGLARQSGRG